jgi:hypothetical protein
MKKRKINGNKKEEGREKKRNSEGNKKGEGG